MERFASSAMMVASFGGVAQRILGVRRVMMNSRRVEVLSGVVVASSAGLVKTIWILTMKIARRFDGGDNFYSVYTRCSLRVC